MDDSIGETTHLLRAHRRGPSERNRLIDHACKRLRHRASQMLRRFPDVGRWEETSDLMNRSLLRLNKALNALEPENSLHFWRICAVQIRRELLSAARRYRGPHGLGANHHTDGRGRAADDPGQPLDLYSGGELESMADWISFHEAVNQLPDDLKDVFSHLYYLGHAQDEAATHLGLSVRTLRRRWREAKLRLYEILTGAGSC